MLGTRDYISCAMVCCSGWEFFELALGSRLYEIRTLTTTSYEVYFGNTFHADTDSKVACQSANYLTCR